MLSDLLVSFVFDREEAKEKVRKSIPRFVLADAFNSIYECPNKRYADCISSRRTIEHSKGFHTIRHKARRLISILIIGFY